MNDEELNSVENSATLADTNSSKGPSQNNSNVELHKTENTLKSTRFVEDQWAPDRPDGKKQYGAEFLLKLRHFPASLLKPDYYIPVNMSLLDDRNSSISKLASSQSKIESKGVDKSQKSQTKLSFSLRDDVKLHETENALKPTCFVKDENPTEEDKKFYKKVRSILNKFTLENFDIVMKQIAVLNIDTPDRLKGVIDIVFEKAIDKPNLFVAYARICKEIQVNKKSAVMAIIRDEDKQHSFNLLLISRCQTVYEKQFLPFLGETEHKKKLKKVTELTCMDPEKKKKLLFKLEEDDRRIRMRSIALIRFIGELFKLNMLTAEIMVKCLQILLANGDDKSLECLCKLLKTIGVELDYEHQHHVALNAIFEELKRIQETYTEPNSPIQDMIQDVIELRDRHWKPIMFDDPVYCTEIYQCGYCGIALYDAYKTHHCLMILDDMKHEHIIDDESKVVILGEKNVQKNQTEEAHYSSASIHTTPSVYTVSQSSSSSSTVSQNMFSSVSEKTSDTNSRRNRKKRKNEETQFKNSMSKVLAEPIIATPATPLAIKPSVSGLEGYLSCLREALEKLPYRKRAQLEIKFLQMALDAINDE